MPTTVYTDARRLNVIIISNCFPREIKLSCTGSIIQAWDEKIENNFNYVDTPLNKLLLQGMQTNVNA